MKSNTTKLALLIMLPCLLFGTSIIAQILPSDLDVLEEYDEEIEVAVKPPKGLDMKKASQMDLYEMIPRKEEQHVKKMLTKKGEMTTIITFKRSKDTPDWIKTAAYSIVTLDGIKSYDDTGKLISDTKASDIAKQAHREHLDKVKKKGSFQEDDFSDISQAEITSLTATGANVKKLADNSIEITGNNAIYRHSKEKGIVYEKYKDDDGKVNEIGKKYAKTKDGDLYIQLARHKKEYKLSNGMGTNFEQITRIKNYTILKNDKYKVKISRGESSSTNSLSIYPNPISDGVLFIQTPKEIMNAKELEINIYNLLGSRILTKTMSNISQEIQIDINNLPSASYFITLNNGVNLYSNRFEKINQ